MHLLSFIHKKKATESLSSDSRRLTCYHLGDSTAVIIYSQSFIFLSRFHWSSHCSVLRCVCVCWQYENVTGWSVGLEAAACLYVCSMVSVRYPKGVFPDCNNPHEEVRAVSNSCVNLLLASRKQSPVSKSSKTDLRVCRCKKREPCWLKRFIVVLRGVLIKTKGHAAMH